MENRFEAKQSHKYTLSKELSDPRTYKDNLSNCHFLGLKQSSLTSIPCRKNSDPRTYKDNLSNGHFL